MSNKIPKSLLTVVITGASSGIGRGVAKRLAAEGAQLVLAARRTSLIDELALECGNAIAVTTDVAKEEDVARLFEAAIAKYGKVDVWINNAGVGAIGPFTDIPLKDHIRVVETNVFGTIYGSHYALRHFKERRAGTLINLASVTSKISFPYYNTYSATKYAIAGLNGSLHQEMELEGFEDIHVCAVHPWATDTPWFEHAGNYSGHEAQMKPMDDADSVVDAIVKLLDDPQESVEVGVKTKGSTISSNLMPGLTEDLNAKYLQKVMQDAPPAENTSGSIHEPMATGVGVSGGIRKRMKRQNESDGASPDDQVSP
ncbi:SDR family NAD(P)-dependent oxidoreductase [Saccharibacillus alkalitolerans]|uniref:SDR family NAD(P)-dependent oxidoreductase n=1 Tax=Saccharibacillus alkalitolerans TaxID=2705290 RepID=A0ABX0F7G7_9BACL|nr:SDR family NAD(P)-dependent oxidoreductase [Saccharibacillus alkalitolerans]NGZ76385.1 SDR family NAD(P)-dependent oxidoreductase [Saccharibacillus alkalitolerans]